MCVESLSGGVDFGDLGGGMDKASKMVGQKELDFAVEGRNNLGMLGEQMRQGRDAAIFGAGYKKGGCASLPGIGVPVNGFATVCRQVAPSLYEMSGCVGGAGRWIEAIMVGREWKRLRNVFVVVLVVTKGCRSLWIVGKGWREYDFGGLALLSVGYYGGVVVVVVVLLLYTVWRCWS